jgi:hypothetical protein
VLREAEIENLDASVACDEEILGLHVTMDDAPLVRSGKAASDLSGVLNRLWRRDRADREPCAKRFTLE